MRSERRSDEEIAHTMRAFESLPEDFDGLVAKLSDSDAEVRHAAAIRLMNLEDRRAVEHLIPMLEDESPRVRFAASLALGHYEAPESVPQLIEHLKNDPAPMVRWVTASALQWFDDPRVAPALAAALHDSDSSVRGMSCSVLGRRSHNDAANHIEPLLHDPEWGVRYNACHVLVELGVGSEQLVRAIRDLRDRPEARERAAMHAEVDAMEAVLDKHPEAAEWMTSEQHDDEESTLLDVLELYRQKLGPDEVPPVPDDPLGDLAERARKLLASRTSET